MIRNVIMLSMNGQGSEVDGGMNAGRGVGEGGNWALTFIYCVRQLYSRLAWHPFVEQQFG